MHIIVIHYLRAITRTGSRDACRPSRNWDDAIEAASNRATMSTDGGRVPMIGRSVESQDCIDYTSGVQQATVTQGLLSTNWFAGSKRSGLFGTSPSANVCQNPMGQTLDASSSAGLPMYNRSNGHSRLVSLHRCGVSAASWLCTEEGETPFGVPSLERQSWVAK